VRGGEARKLPGATWASLCTETQSQYMYIHVVCGCVCVYVYVSVCVCVCVCACMHVYGVDRGASLWNMSGTLKESCHT